MQTSVSPSPSAGAVRHPLGAQRHARDRRETRRPADLGTLRGALWASLGVVLVLGVSNPTILEPHMPTTFLRLALATACVVIFDWRRVCVPRVPVLLLAFLSFCFLTILWTSDQEATASAVMLYAGLAFMATLLVQNTSGPLLVRTMTWSAVVVMALSWGAVWLGNPLALGPSGETLVLQGLYGNRNIIAYVMVIGLAAILADRFSTLVGKIVKGAVVLLVLVTMFYIGSGTGSVAAGVVLLVAVVLRAMEWVSPRWRRRLRIPLGSLAIVALVAVFINFQQILDLLGKNATFSGRTPLWAGIIDAWRDAPVGGYGWGSVWAYAWFEIPDSPVRARINAFVGYPLNHGHNAILDVLVQVGLIGTLLYLALVVTSLVRGSREIFTSPSSDRSWVVLVILAVLICGITEPLFAAPIGWFVVVAASSRAALLSWDRQSAPSRARHSASG